MVDDISACIICRGAAGDPDLGRIQVWEDDHWRLTVSLVAEVLGFAYLEPKRHIPHITDLDGEEAHTFGAVLARVSTALSAKQAQNSCLCTYPVTGCPICMFISRHTARVMR